MPERFITDDSGIIFGFQIVEVKQLERFTESVTLIEQYICEF